MSETVTESDESEQTPVVMKTVQLHGAIAGFGEAQEVITIPEHRADMLIRTERAVEVLDDEADSEPVDEPEEIGDAAPAKTKRPASGGGVDLGEAGRSGLDSTQPAGPNDN